MKHRLQELWLNSGVTEDKVTASPEAAGQSGFSLDSVGAALRSLVDWFLEY